MGKVDVYYGNEGPYTGDRSNDQDEQAVVLLPSAAGTMTIIVPKTALTQIAPGKWELRLPK